MEKENKTNLNAGVSDTPHSRVNQICCSLIGQEQKKDTLIITAELQVGEECCPFCGSIGLKTHGRGQATYIDRPLDDRKVRIRVRRPRMICQYCRKTFTPPVPGIVERQRVTQGFVEYMRVNLFYYSSIRDFSIKTGVEPKTVTAIIYYLCDEHHANIEIPKRVGITRLPVANHALMLYFSLDRKTILDVKTQNKTESLTAGNEISNIVQSDNLSELFVPADFGLVKELTKYVDVAKMKITLSAIDDLASASIARNIEKWFGRGIPNNISKHKAKILAYIRKHQLNKLDAKLLILGISENSNFWKAYKAKEDFLQLLEGNRNNVSSLNRILTRWQHKLDLETKLVFSELGTVLDQLDKIGIQFSNNQKYDDFTHTINWLKYILNRPGNKYSTEIIKRMILTTKLFAVTPQKLPTINVKAGLPSWIGGVEINISEIAFGIELSELARLIEYSLPNFLANLRPPRLGDKSPSPFISDW